GGGFRTALAAVGSRLLVGAPNLGSAGSTDAHGYLFDPATGELVHDLVVPVGRERWSHFSVGAVGARPFVGIDPDDDYGGDATVSMFDPESGATTRTLCCWGGIAAGGGSRIVIDAFHGGGSVEPDTGDLVAAL